MGYVKIKGAELVWNGKYDDEGNLKPVEKPGPYPFQIVETINAPRISRGGPSDQPTLFDIWENNEGETFEEGWKNKLIWGENKFVMSSLLEKFAGKIDLIYIDPPFATGADFKVGIQIGEDGMKVEKEHSIIEEKAYRDTWGRGIDSYLQMMYERLTLMKELLSDTGSIYVHLDYRMVHYVKLIMDEIFGRENFRNEIVWCYAGGAIPKTDFPRKHDVILRYAKTDKFLFYPPMRPYSPTGSGVHSNGSKYDKEKGETPHNDWWIDIDPVNTMSKERMNYPTQKPEKLLKRIILASSNPGDLVADFFCGSGTTLAVAEKLGRRWIGVDLSRYAIHVTRKRLLDIEKSKDLMDESGRKLYGKKARPFEILNLGKYERHYWQVKSFNNRDEKQLFYEYIAFMLKLYHAEPISGSSVIHGRKGPAYVYIGSVDSPVTIQEVIDAMEECKNLGGRELHVLGWEWEMGLNNAIRDIAKHYGINLKLRIIPKEVTDPQAVEKGDIQFFELAYFDVDIKKLGGRKIELELKNFVIPHTDLIPNDIASMIKKWTDWIDYWAIDFNFQNDTFNNTWTSYRTKKDRSLQLKADYTYTEPGKYKIFVKIIDIFGVDTSQIYEVEVE